MTKPQTLVEMINDLCLHDAVIEAALAEIERIIAQHNLDMATAFET